MTKSEFYQLFVEELKNLYSAEQQLVQALPKVANAAHDLDLKGAIDTHLLETKNQVARLERIFEILNEAKQITPNKVMANLIFEADKVVQIQQPSLVRDAALISVAQKIEHYEIAVYGTTIAFAKQLGFYEVADFLQESLDEESNADRTLNYLAEGGLLTAGINQRAQEQ